MPVFIRDDPSNWTRIGMHSLQHLCECIALFSSTFSFAGRVAEGKDDGAFIERGHVPDDLFREGSSNSCHTWDSNVLFIPFGNF